MADIGVLEGCSTLSPVVWSGQAQEQLAAELKQCLQSAEDELAAATSDAKARLSKVNGLMGCT